MNVLVIGVAGFVLGGLSFMLPPLVGQLFYSGGVFGCMPGESCMVLGSMDIAWAVDLIFAFSLLIYVTWIVGPLVMVLSYLLMFVGMCILAIQKIQKSVHPMRFLWLLLPLLLLIPPAVYFMR